MRVTKRWAKLFLVTLLVFYLLAFAAAAASGDTIVYITNTGEKYHSYGCQYLRKSSISITLSSAVSSGYGRCSRCSPPYLDQSTTSISPSTSTQYSDRLDTLLGYTDELENRHAEVTQAGAVEKIYSQYDMDMAISRARENALNDKNEAIEAAVQKAVLEAEVDAEVQLNETVERIQNEHEADIKSIKRSYRNSMIWVLCLMGVAVLILLVLLVRQRRENRSQVQKISSLQNSIKSLEQNIQDLKDRENIIQDFGGMDCRTKAGVPADVVFGMDYIPVKIGGESCVVFLNKDMSRYHKKWCRYSSTSAKNVFSLPKECRPCKVCNPITVEKQPKWLLDYSRYIDTKKRFGIPDPDIPYPEYKE